MHAIPVLDQMTSNVDAAIFSTNNIDIADRLAGINMVRDDEYIMVITPLGISIIAPMNPPLEGVGGGFEYQ